MHSFASEHLHQTNSSVVLIYKIYMAILSRFWLCTILVMCLAVVASESRSLPSSLESRATKKSKFPLGAHHRILVVVSGLKGMKNAQHKPNRLSPMGPDPRHH